MVAQNYELRARAREQLKGNWGKPILVCFLYLVITMATVFVPIVGVYAIYLIAGPIMIGIFLYSLKFVRGINPGVEIMFSGFKNFASALGLYLWMILWVYIWALLFVIPGIVKGYAYCMCFYIMADNPKVGIRKALKMSQAMTYGYKGKIFVLYLSFLGWMILCTLTLFIGYLWLMPYMAMSFANLYEELKREAIEKGVCVASDFGEVEVSNEDIGVEI